MIKFINNEKKTIYIGIDPGKAGYITIFDGKDFTFYGMPTRDIPTGDYLQSGRLKTKKVFDEYFLKDILKEIKEDYKDCDIKIAIEKVVGRGGWSAESIFNFGYTSGLLKMMSIMLTSDIIEVRPLKWQSYMRQGYSLIKKRSFTGKTQINDAKAIAEMIVKKEYPNIDFRKTTKSKNNDDNKIDSFLICLYLYRININNKK